MSSLRLTGGSSSSSRDTLEVVVRHLARVAEVANKMDVDNLALLFGQVILWPDPNIPVDLNLITGKNPL